MPIYTRTGDSGTTAVFGGKRLSKSHEQIDAYGSIDELNSWIGLVGAYVTPFDVKSFLGLVQQDLLTVGASLAGAKQDLSFIHKRVTEMEARIDAMEKSLPKLSNFILPGGSKLAAFLHIVRSVCRRTERKIVRLHESSPIDLSIITYINRLSDFMFVFARFVNAEEKGEEKVWKK